MKRSPHSSQSGIALTRVRDFFGIFASVRVLVDGADAARLAYGQSAVFFLEPGVHAIQVRMSWCRSDIKKVEVGPDSFTHLECGARFHGWIWTLGVVTVFLSPRRFFDVGPATQRVGKSDSLIPLIGGVLTVAIALKIIVDLIHALVVRFRS